LDRVVGHRGEIARAVAQVGDGLQRRRVTGLREVFRERERAPGLVGVADMRVLGAPARGKFLGGRRLRRNTISAA
jgi:hypothetical protein